MSQQHARLAAVEERQLRPIYEALDTGNVKSALTHCNKLLKKYPSPPAINGPATVTPQTITRQLLTALKILALVRANKLDEASTITTALLSETPTDENVLSTLAHSLKPLDRPKELVKMWVDAWTRANKECDELKKKIGKKGGITEMEMGAKMQRNEELGAQAFMAMVRTGHWAMAQQTAFKLYRAFTPKEGDALVHPTVRYLYWSAISAVMQSQYPNPPPPVPVLVMIPPPAQVREWEESKKKEEEEDRKLLEQAGLSVNGAGTHSTQSSISPSRRKKRAFALSLAKRLVDMTMDQQAKEVGVARSMNTERFWLWAEVLRRVADAAVDDEKSGLVQATNAEPLQHYAEAKKTLTSEIATKFAMDSLHVEELRSDIARKSEDWKRECEGMAQRLNAGDRNWKTFITFMDALFHFIPDAPQEPDVYPSFVYIKKPEPNSTTEGDEATPNDDAKDKKLVEGTQQSELLTLANTRAFLKRLADGDEAAGPGRERAGLLGVLELERRARKMPGLTAEDAPNYGDLLTAYFDRFGSKPVIVEDLLIYISELDPESEERKKWDAYISAVELKTDNLKALQTTINVLKFQRMLSSSASITVESELAFAKTCAALYHAGLPLGKNLVSTELQPADDLAVLAATALIHAHHLSAIEASKEGSTVESANTLQAPLFDTLVLLEQTVTTSRWAYTPRLILTRLYRLLAAPSLAMQHYGLANLKSIQFDTLSHHVLNRASTFSLGCNGDLTLVNECVESSQIYSVNGVDTSEQLVKAFQQERYSQIADFVLLEERVDNSLQRDLTKLEHFRMKNLHEGLTPESVEVELVELRFVWGRVHFDNRDFDLLPSYQPQGAVSLDDMTSVGGKRLSQQWFNTMLKMWILVLHQASEQLWTEEEQKTVMGPISTFNEVDLAELTEGERLLVTYSRAVINWLAPHHAPLKHTVMTNAVSVLSAAKAKQAASQSTTTTTPQASSNSAAVKAKSNTGRKANGLSNGTEGTASSGGDGIGVKVGDVKVVTGMLTLHEPMEVPPIPADLGEPVKEAPEELNSLLDQFQKMFDDAVAKPTVLPWECLHVAQLIHEAAFITHLLTARFALSGGKKKAHPTYKPLRAKCLAVLEHVAKGMTTLAEENDFNAEVRKAWLHDRKSSGVLEEHTDEQIVMVGRGLMESRKKIFEGLGKGMNRALQTVAKAAAGVPVGST